eukprot:g2140.t1
MLYGSDSEAKESSEEKKPKGWQRLRERTKWKAGDSCAICMRGAITGRCKPCSHRSMCEACYQEYKEEDRGVFCPICFEEVNILLSDSVASMESLGSDDSDDSWEPLVDEHEAAVHRRANLAAARLANPSALGTTATEIGQTFGTGTGVAFLHLGSLCFLLLFIALFQLPNAYSNHVMGSRTGKIIRQAPGTFVSSTLGNCGASRCGVQNRKYITYIDALGFAICGLCCLWIRAKLRVFEHHIGDKIIATGRRTLLVENLPGLLTHEKAHNFFARYGRIEKVEILSDLDSLELDLLEKRRRYATELRIAEATSEFGDRRAMCAGDCIAEDEWGQWNAPKLDRKLQAVELRLNKLTERQPQSSRVFLWFANEADRDAAARKMKKFGGSLLNSVLSCFQFAIFASGSSFFIRGLGDQGLCTIHPGVFPSNLMYHNTAVRRCNRNIWKFVSFLVLIAAAFACAGFFFTSRSIPPLAALQLVATNEIMARMVQNLIRKQRLYLRTAMNDAVCAYVFFLSLFNVLSFAIAGSTARSEDPSSSFSVESDIEASSSPSSATFTRDWYDLGSGEVLHFYVVIDGLWASLGEVVMTMNHQRNRRRKIYTANCQEQLLRYHSGRNVDFMLHHSKALVAPVVSIIFSVGLPVLPALAMVALVLKLVALRWLLVTEARIPLWRDGAIVKWGSRVIQVAVLVHFPVTIIMISSVSSPEGVATTWITWLCFLVASGMFLVATVLAPCCGAVLSRASPIIAPLAERSRYHSEDSDDEDPLVHMDEDMQELLKHANEAFNVDVVISPSLYTSFEASKHPVFGAEIRMRQSLAKAYRIQRDAENRQAMRQKAKDDALDEAIRRQRERAKNAKLRLNKYVKHMTKKNAKRRGFKQEKPARRQQHDEDANNFIV